MWRIWCGWQAECGPYTDLNTYTWDIVRVIEYRHGSWMRINDL